MTSGHSWITYFPDGGVAQTYGTWGNNPVGLGNGLFVNIEKELGMVGDATRSLHIDDSQEQAVLALIRQYLNMGPNAWQYGAPCSSFARDAWKAGTGESLNANWGPISNPTTLKESIVQANGGVNSLIATKPNTGSSANACSCSGSSSGSSGSSFNSLGSLLQ